MDVLLSTGELVASTLLTMAIRNLGYQAIVSAAPSRYKTDTTYRKARIVKIENQAYSGRTAEGQIVNRCRLPGDYR